MPGVLCLALAGGLRWFGPALLRGLRAQWELGVAGGELQLAGLGAAVLKGFGAVALVVLAALLLALAGGVVFKGRSGWCGTFCPLSPVQRTYGQAPLVVVKNGYCNPCVGCQKSCYDFNPRAAVFSDIYDDDPRHAAQRRRRWLDGDSGGSVTAGGYAWRIFM